MNAFPSLRSPLCALTALLSFGLGSDALAQSVATTPVGVVKITVNANSDQRFGITFLRPIIYAGIIEGAPTNVITKSTSITALGSEAKYVKFVSGAAEGQWFQVTAFNTSSITLQENLHSFGVVAGDKFEVRAFWTLATLLANGGGLPVSPDVFNPRAYILLNNPEAIGINLAAAAGYFYHDGSQGPAGWYKADGSFTLADNTVVSPECSLVIRNSTGQTAAIFNSGEVPVAKVANVVVSRAAGRQDNLVYNPYPLGVTLSASGLVSSLAVRPSPDVYNPVDLVLVYSTNNTGKNASASAGYFYHDGSQGPAGWYSADGSFSISDSVQLAAGGAITIRKAAGQNTEKEWVPPVPY